MAGIERARELVRQKRHVGKVVAFGKEKGVNGPVYMLVRTKSQKYDQFVWVHCYGSDIRIGKKVKLWDKVKLTILDRYTAIWDKV